MKAAQPSRRVDDPLVGVRKAAPPVDQRLSTVFRSKVELTARMTSSASAGGGLLLQRLAQLVEQPGVLDGDDGLLGEILD